MKTIRFCLLLVCLTYLVSCGRVDVGNSLNSDRFSSILKSVSLDSTNSNLAEAATPKIIKELNQDVEQFAPQVKIISPQAGQIFNQTDITVQLKVQDLPVFQDDKLKLGNHLDLILDNEPVQQIYNLDEPVILENLSPGTHTIRVFASRPWGESFKNDGAYAQKTFSVLTETNDNRPDPHLPLLTYSNPRGTYGAEPILLDFYLTNAPLHAVAQSDPNLQDWQIRTTVNGTSFILENWQPVYLTGLNEGTNWIQLELIDEAGNNIENAFNNTVRVINYDPQRVDTLAKLVTNKISLAEARPMVEQNYYIQPVETPEIIEPSEQVESEPAETTINGQELINNIELRGEEIRETKESEEETPTAISEAGARSAIAIPAEESNLNSISRSDMEQVDPEESEQSVIIPAPETKTIDEVEETAEDISVEEIDRINLKNTQEVVDKTEAQEIIAITQEISDSPKQEAEIKNPQPELEAISEDEISIDIPETEPIKTQDQTNETTVWWQKILLSLRQKLENLVRILPNPNNV